MQKLVDPSRLVGKRFVTDFRILAIGLGAKGEPEATLVMYGDTYFVSR